MVELWRQTTSENVQAVMATFREETEMTALWVPKVTKNKVKQIAQGLRVNVMVQKFSTTEMQYKILTQGSKFRNDFHWVEENFPRQLR